MNTNVRQRKKKKIEHKLLKCYLQASVKNRPNLLIKTDFLRSSDHFARSWTSQIFTCYTSSDSNSRADRDKKKRAFCVKQFCRRDISNINFQIFVENCFGDYRRRFLDSKAITTANTLFDAELNGLHNMSNSYRTVYC